MKHLSFSFKEILSNCQFQAVNFTGKPLLVLAGAGSGKTRVITYKIAYLLTRGFSSNKILAITFTRKAASEMKHRIFSLSGMESSWISTFHSFCLKVLRQHIYKLNSGRTADFIVYDDDEALKLFKRICDSSHYCLDDAQELFNKISYLKQFGEINKWHLNAIEYEIYTQYEQALRDSNAVDFDNIQLFAYKLLSIPEVSSYFRNFFDYILIDEFQDTSPIQYAIIKSITRDGNITAVGDPQQSIYSFRGAAVDNILKFINDFKPEIIKLEENYRSCKVILHVANTVSELIDERWKSLVIDLKPFRAETGSLKIKTHQDEYSEALWIVENVKALLEELPPHEIAILVRSRFVKPTIKEVFLNHGMSILDVDDFNLFKRTEVKDVLSYLRFAYNPNDFVSFERAISTPSKGIGEKTVEKIITLAEQTQGDYLKAAKVYVNQTNLKGKTKRVADFIKLIEYIQGFLNNPSLALDIVIRATNYPNYLKEKYKSNYEDRFASLVELGNLLKRHSSFKDLLDSALLYETKQPLDAVRLMTVHSAKGLEFAAILLPALEQGIFPDGRNSFDEEIRVFYVATTRAKDWLFLSACHSRERFGKRINSKPSVFFEYVVEKLQSKSFSLPFVPFK